MTGTAWIPPIVLALAVGWGVLGWVGFATRSGAELTRSLDQLSFPLAVEFVPPPVGAPGNREDAGSRGISCGRSGIRFTALVPATNVGLTVEEHPTFWLYVPCSPGSVQLVLKDEESEETIYETTFQVTEGPGIVSFRLPETAPALEIERKYRWMFFWSQNPENASFVSGVVIRKTLKAPLQQQLDGASPQERMEIYGANGWWYDLLTELGQGYRESPQDDELASEWAELLQHPAVRLDEMVSETIVPCCSSD